MAAKGYAGRAGKVRSTKAIKLPAEFSAAVKQCHFRSDTANYSEVSSAVAISTRYNILKIYIYYVWCCRGVGLKTG